MLNALKTRVLQRDFDSGRIPENPTSNDLKEMYRQTAVDEIITEEEWADALEMVITWRDTRAEQFGDTSEITLRKIFSKFKRFPTVKRVEELFGQDRAEEYRIALEEIETLPMVSALMPAEKVPYPWKKIEMDAAVTLVTKLIAPSSSIEDLSKQYETFLGELAARRRERTRMSIATGVKEKKQIAKSIGIWFPLSKDIEQWRKDPRTAAKMPEFEKLIKQVSDRMRLVRSYLQYIPKRRLSVTACKDLDANMVRMKIYLQGFAKRVNEISIKTQSQ